VRGLLLRGGEGKEGEEGDGGERRKGKGREMDGRKGLPRFEKFFLATLLGEVQDSWHSQS